MTEPLHTPLPSMDEELARAHAAHASGDVEGADAACRRILKERPGDPAATLLLSRMLLARGNAFFATALLEAAARRDPHDVGVKVALARALVTEGEAAAALEQANGALAIDPQDAAALLEQGIALGALGRWDEGVPAIERAAEGGRQGPEAQFWLANGLLALGLHDRGAAAFERACDLDEDYRDRHRSQGRAAQSAGQDERARELYRWGLLLLPGDPELTHYLAALDEADVPDRAAEDYVSGHFDRFAERFDQQLVNELRYRGPELTVGALRPHVRPQHIRALDAGCGTGLCGLLLREFAETLHGVDLSSEMLARARAREIYDELRRDELVSDIARHANAYDVIVAADVLIYFGDLDALFAAMARALTEGGLLALSAERTEDGATWVLQPSGRYEHSAQYLRALADAYGFEELHMTREQLRIESGKPVEALIAVFRKLR
ncbi:MAG: hypothetical protein QOJ21_2983 [Solirubrobacteraceae bacterium]|nr:hypothetical protein [Solirubrobacteraceae bacterium]